MNIYHVIVNNLHNVYPKKPWNTSRPVEDAKTLYPNLCAELLNARPSFDSFCEHANITPEILVSIIEDGEPMTRQEIRGLARLLDCTYSYLESPVLGVVDPSTHKGKVRWLKLQQLVEKLDLKAPEFYHSELEKEKDAIDMHGLILNHYLRGCAVRIPSLFEALSTNGVVTYAGYRRAINDAEEALDLKQHPPKKPTMRNYRLSEREV